MVRTISPMDVPDYKVQPRDILYVSVKAQTPEGALTEMLNDKAGSQYQLYAGRSITVYYGIQH